MDEEVLQTINTILNRGNDVEVRRKGNGCVVLEVKKSIKYATPA